ncbi:MAG: hypothetical protein COB36_07670 [Alphaproteobacteria bacterium]|nr:MAG: hypothetical protein COB36_07670 [Alphaproteobacteria bacterium]
MSIIPLIVGCIFFAVGFNIILNFMRFRSQGIRIKGRVTAIEKYTARTGTGRSSTRSTFYSPIVEYSYKDQTRTTAGISTNEIKHKLNQNVTILIMESKEDGSIQDCLDNSSHYLMGIIFALAGLACLTVYILINGSWTLTIIALPTVTGVGHIICTLSRNVKGLIQSSDGHTKQSEDSIFIETKADYIKEITSHSFWANILAFGLMFAGLGILYSGYKQLPAAATEMLNTNLELFWATITSEEMPNSWEDPLILCGIGSFFFLISLRSIYYVRKKYGGMMKM